jgi:thiamine phosphate synthase YjbQ (UPF0047 family)
MKAFTEYLTLNVPGKMTFVNITPQVQAAITKSGVQEGMVIEWFESAPRALKKKQDELSELEERIREVEQEAENVNGKRSSRKASRTTSS